MSYWLILIPLSFFLIMLFLNIKITKRILSFYNLLLIWYSFSLIANIASGLYFEYRFDLKAVIYYTLVVYLFIFPFRYFRPETIDVFFKPNYDYFLIVGLVIIILSFSNILYCSFNIMSAFSSGDYSFFRQSLNEAALFQPKQSFLEIIVNFSNSLFFIPLTLYFVGLVMGYNRIITTLLLISSFSIIIFHFSQVGRTGVVYWTIFFATNIIFFKRFIRPPQMIRKIINRFLVISALLAIVFNIITLNRFADYSYKTVSDSIVDNPIASNLDYFGQSVVNFDVFYKREYSDYLHGAFLFPLFNRTLSYFGLIPNALMEMYDGIRTSNPNNWSMFATYLRELWYDVGPFGAILVGILFNILVIKICKSLRKGVHVKILLLAFFLYAIPFLGLFSFPFSTMNYNFALILLLLIPF